MKNLIYEDPTSIQIFTVDDVLDITECEQLIDFIEANDPKEATITTRQGFIHAPGVRNNTRVIDDSPVRADWLLQKIKNHLPEEKCGRKLVGLNERFRFYKYMPGQYFKWHFDGAYHRSPEEQSYLTVLVYLNGDCEGGETEFEGLDDDKVIPKAGRMLIFDHPILHQGAPVTWGVKYVLRTDVMYRDK